MFESPCQEDLAQKENAIGISPSHLHKVYPYHLAINNDLQFIQIGESLSKLIGTTQDLEGVQIRNLFDITSPICQWDIDEIESLDSCTFEIQLKSNFMLNRNSATISLKGGVIVSTQSNGKRTALFLLSPSFNDSADLIHDGYNPSETNNYTCQEELFTLRK